MKKSVKLIDYTPGQTVYWKEGSKLDKKWKNI